METIERLEAQTPFTPDSEESKSLARILQKGVRRSEWVSRSGAPGKYFFNLDLVYEGLAGDVKASQEFHDEVAQRIRDILDETQAIAKPIKHIAIPIPPAGPVGAVQLRAAMADRIKLPTHNIRLGRRLTRSQIGMDPHGRLNSDLVPKPIKEGDNVLVVVDATTTGGNVYWTAEILWKLGAFTTHALAIYDRAEGAARNLASAGITLECLLTCNNLIAAGTLNGEERGVYTYHNLAMTSFGM